MRSAALVRRPVFDRQLEVVAYEVLLGDGPITEMAASGDEDERRIVVNSVAEIDFAEIGADQPLQLTVTTPVIEAGFPSVLVPSETVLVLGTGVEPSDAVIAALESYRSLGFRVQIDDLDANPQLHSLLRLATTVRVNYDAAARSALGKRIGILKTAGATLVADRIGTYEELTAAIRLGFDQFQGSFLSRPEGFRNTEVPASKLEGLELITLLLDPEADVAKIAQLVRRDVSLSYRILRVVNSAQYSLPRPLSSIEEAVKLVGSSQIVSWVGAMNMSRGNDKPIELTRVALIRARACELLGDRLGRSDLQRFYTVGLFSVVEALLDIPAEQALRKLPLSSEIVQAITTGNGIMGEVLRGVVAYEQADWDRAHVVGVKDEVLSTAFRTAMAETDATWSQISV
jgi:EAL and modified HD-GYP domain-containing signal transduction protein